MQFKIKIAEKLAIFRVKGTDIFLQFSIDIILQLSIKDISFSERVLI